MPIVLKVAASEEKLRALSCLGGGVLFTGMSRRFQQRHLARLSTAQSSVPCTAHAPVAGQELFEANKESCRTIIFVCDRYTVYSLGRRLEGVFPTVTKLHAGTVAPVVNAEVCVASVE